MPDLLRILVYSSYLPDPVDGASTSGRALVKRLRERKVDVTVCTTDQGWTQEQLHTVEKQIKVFHAWSSHRLELAPGLLLFFRKVFESFDLIHFRGVFSLGTVVGARLALSMGKPYVISPLGNWVPSWTERRSVRSGTTKHIFFKYFLRKAMLHADRVVCTSDAELEVTRRQLISDNLVVIPDGVNAAAYAIRTERRLLQEQLSIPPDKEIFLFLGRIAQEKALGFLLDAWQKLISNRPNAVLVIAGSCDHPSYGEQLRRRAMALTRPETVSFTGPVRDEIKLTLLQHSRCLLLPSYRESFGIVVLEALASGTPVIASHGTRWECLESQGLGRWLPWSEDRWVEAMIELAELPPLHRHRFAAKSTEWVAGNFSWESVAEEYIDIYKKIVRRDQES